ncbi:MAG: RibD family protein [Gemmatimonadota bacterium]
MSVRVDEPRAWRMVRALTPGSVPEDGVIRVQDDDAFIEVDAAGGWSTSAPVDEAARAILDLYLPIRTPRELVIGQLGQSLDGRIATESGASHFITGPEDIERLHRVRALVDAVVVGATTVVADDPRLTVRLVEGDNPVRVVIDPSRRVGPGLRVRADGIARTILVRRATEEARHADTHGDELHVPASGDGHLDLDALLAGLRSLGHRRVLIEGGGLTVSGFLEADLLDRLHVCVAPLLIGSGRPSIALAAIERLDEAIRAPSRHFTLGRDVLFDLDLRSPS